MKRTSIQSSTLLIFTLVIFLSNGSSAQTGVTFGQQISVLKSLKGDLQVIGVISSTLNENDVANLTRSALQMGIKIFVAEPKSPKEIPELYRKLVSEKKVQLILIPTSDDKMVLQFGFDFLKENSMLDKIGLCVPDLEFLAQGGMCFIGKENGKFMVYVNQKVSAFMGVTVPQNESPSINFVLR
jgi:ABC-type uncharacterized transport system substrate-binding protein